MYRSGFIVTSCVCLLLVFRAPNILFMWAIYEAGLFLFLGLVVKSRTARNVGHYYLVQSSGSALFLMGYLIANPVLVGAGLTIKLGLRPIHFWVPIIAFDLD